MPFILWECTVRWYARWHKEKNIIRYHINCHSAVVTSRNFGNNKTLVLLHRNLTLTLEGPHLDTFCIFHHSDLKNDLKTSHWFYIFFSFKIYSVRIFFQKVLIFLQLKSCPVYLVLVWFLQLWVRVSVCLLLMGFVATTAPLPALLRWKSLGIPEVQMRPQLSSASALEACLFLMCPKRVDNSLCSDFVWEYTPSCVPKQVMVWWATHKDVVPRDEFYPIKTQM